jgi:hypothetical protein
VATSVTVFERFSNGRTFSITKSVRSAIWFRAPPSERGLLQAPEKCRLVIADHGDPEAIPASRIYPHTPWTLDDFVIAMATLLQSVIAIIKPDSRYLRCQVDRARLGYSLHQELG